MSNREKLDAMFEKYEESKQVVYDQKIENDKLKLTLAEKQELVVEQMKKDLKDLGQYVKDLDWADRHLWLSVNVDFYASSYGNKPRIIIEFDDAGEAKIKCNPSGYSHNPTMFDTKTGHWGWYDKESKKFVTENWTKISDELEDEIIKTLERVAEANVNKVNIERQDLICSIENTNTNIDFSARKDVLLYNAISLVIDETFEQYEDKNEWFNMLMNEFGTTPDELMELGIKVTAAGGLSLVDKENSLDKTLGEATERSESLNSGRDNDVNKNIVFDI